MSEKNGQFHGASLNRGKTPISLILRKAAPLFFACILAVSSCGESSKDDDKDTSGGENSKSVLNSLVNIPGCISASSAERGSRAQSDQILSVYDGIRDTVGGVEDIARQVAETVDSLEKNVLSQGDSGEWTNPSPDADDPTKVVWGADTAGYDTRVDVYFTDPADSIERLVIVAHITWVGELAKGRIIWNMANAPDPEESDVKLDVTFDGTADKKTMSVLAIDLGTDTSEPVTVQVNASTQNGILSLAGAYYIPAVKPDNDKPETEARVYNFTAIGYDDEGKGGEKADKAVLQLALPKADLATTDTMFASYSVREVFLTWMTEKLKRDVSAATYANWKSAASLSAATAAELTNTDTEKLLAHYASVEPENADLSSMMYVLKLVNPAYFDEGGFAGTCDGTSSGTLTAAPSWAGADELDIDEVDPIVSSAVAALKFNDETFVIE